MIIISLFYFYCYCYWSYDWKYGGLVAKKKYRKKDRLAHMKDIRNTAYKTKHERMIKYKKKYFNDLDDGWTNSKSKRKNKYHKEIYK